MELLLLHGFRGNHLGLNEIAKRLRHEGHKVFVPDLPPAERGQLSEYTPDAYAKWVANYILEEKLNRPVLIGHSMGSIVAAATAERYPELIHQKIVFLAPISTRPPKFLVPLTPISVLLPNSLVSHITTRYLIVRGGRAFYRNTVALTERCAANYISRRDTMKAAAFAERHAISDFNFDRDPLFIAGEVDRLNSKRDTIATAKKYHGSAVFLKSCGHLLNYEAPTRVADRIIKFLSDKDQPQNLKK